ncbi:hypothetical protein I6E81_00300 [Salinibacterium sp. NG22]|uniref:hypothetical protein n=1 Tax=Salinibacterium sp. NG22 TaxID=2792040 RepID=UPI0018CD870B|nr:hypothetical protein [Salinibacterium sp. NG22]MBH0108602.1 hypothetical protein [Salinibacterium sp. NG22]
MCKKANARSKNTPQLPAVTVEPPCEGDSDVIAPPFPPLSASEHAALHANDDPIAEWIEELAPTTGL